VTSIKLKYIHEFRDRHGKVRRYFRRGRFKVALPGLPGSAEFMDTYRDAVERHATNAPPVAEKRTKPRSINALAIAYYGSTAFLQLRETTKPAYRGEIERLRAEHGDKPADRLERRHIQAMLAAKMQSGGPEAANNRLRILRLLVKCAIDLGWRDDNPTLGIKKMASTTGGFHSWTEDEIAAYETHWPIGTRARLAFALLLFTAQRRGDAIRMGRQHVRNGVIEVKQSKTGAELAIPLHPDLVTVLDAAPREHLTFLTTAAGKPFSAAGFGNWFRECCDAAGLPQCTAHGLRKAAATRLANAGCSPHEIAAFTGHKNLSMVAHYTRAHDQQRLARTAMDAQTRTETEQTLANLQVGSQNREFNPLKRNREK
jgi:integrase